MSVDLSIIVKHDFEDTDNHEACRKFLLKTIDELKKFFCSDDVVDDIRMDKEYEEYSFILKPFDDVHVWLHKGCWEFETCFGYARYFVKNIDNDNGLRRLAFSIARAFGKEEAWITDEYHGWNGTLESVSDGFDTWLASDSRAEGYSNDVVEFNPADFPNVGDWNNNYGTKYHDSFKEQRTEYDRLSNNFPGFELLTISPIASVLLAKKDGKLYALNIDTKQPFVNYPIDAVNTNFNTVAIEIFKNGASALFNREGEQLTTFGKHEFNWTWEKPYINEKVRVTDDITGKYWVFPL